MYENEIIFKYLSLLELNNNTIVTQELINKQYHKLAKIYHTDFADEKFILIQEAKKYLLKNISKVNRYILDNKLDEEIHNAREGMWYKTAEEEARKKTEEQRKAQEEENRKKAEEQRRAQEKETRKRAEQQRIIDEKNNIKNELNDLLQNIDPAYYYEKQYNYILKLVNDFLNDLPTAINYKKDYADLIEKIKKVKNKKNYDKLERIKKIVFVIATILAVTIVLLVIFLNFGISAIEKNKQQEENNRIAMQYNKALAYIMNDNLYEAYDILNSIDYNHSHELASDLKNIFYLKSYIQHNFSVESIDNILVKLKQHSYNLFFNYDNSDYKLENESEIEGYYRSAYKNGYIFNNYKLKNISYNIFNKDITFELVAEFVAKEYFVYYDFDGGYIDGSKPNSFTIMTDYLMIPQPIKRGHTFVVWENNFYDGLVMDSIKINKNKIDTLFLKAIWEPTKYKIHFNTNGGIAIKDITVEYNSIVTLPTCKKNGYTFKGWYYKGQKITTTDYKYVNDYDIEIYADWEIYEYKIDYILFGGIADNPASYNVETDTFILNNPVKKGYIFTEWQELKYLLPPSEVMIIEKGTIGDKTFIAVYEIIEYKIIYHLDCPNNSNNVTTYTINDSVKLYPPQKEGYIFDGWFDSSGNKIDSIEVGTIGDIDLYAKFSPKKYNIVINSMSFNANFYMNDETNKIFETQKITIDKGIIYPLLPKRSNYCFTGWYTEKECLNLYDFSKMIYYDLNLYAGWEKMDGCIIIDGRTSNINLNNYYVSNSRGSMTYAFCSLNGGPITLTFQNKNRIERSISITNRTKNITIYNKKIDWYDSEQIVEIESDPGDIITVSSFSITSTNNVLVKISGVITPLDGATAYDTYNKYEVYYNENFIIDTREIEGYKFIGYVDQYNNMITDELGNSIDVYNYEYDLYLTEVWIKEKS